MKKIPLPGGVFALVDDEDYQDISLFNWYLSHGYANRHLPRENGARGMESMHRRIMGLKKGDPKQVDHIDGNGLNNQRENLRICTRSENSRNCKIRKDNTSGFKGVYFNKGKFQAYIAVNGKIKNLGRFENAEDAHEFYCLAADILHGEFANHG